MAEGPGVGRRLSVFALRAGDFPDGPPVGEDVCGIDEAGRGPLAGPVTAACVVLPAGFPTGSLRDSKLLARAKREDLAGCIIGSALAWSLGFASHEEIDAFNILGATMLAMRRAYLTLGFSPAIVYVDGTCSPDLHRYTIPDRDGTESSRPPAARVLPVIDGDAFIPCVMAAGILAKTARDATMRRFDELYPSFGYGRHKGYPTREHRTLLARFGPSPIQRRTFRF